MDGALFVGVDWGSETHQVCVIDAQRRKLLEWAVEHSGKGLSSLAEKLLELAAGESSRLSVAIEVPRGPVVDALLERRIPVFAVNPKQLDRFRDRHTVAGAKDDRRDALVLADSLRTDRAAFRQVQLGDATLVQLRELCRLQDELKAERITLGNRLREQLLRYFPQILELDSIYKRPWIWALLAKASTPQEAAQLSLAKLRSLLSAHGIRRLTPEQVRETLKAEPLHVAPGVVQACQRSATRAASCDDYWKARYAALRAKGHAHARAVRGLADRLLAVLLAMLKTGQPCDPAPKRAVPGAIMSHLHPVDLALA